MTFDFSKLIEKVKTDTSDNIQSVSVETKINAANEIKGNNEHVELLEEYYKERSELHNSIYGDHEGDTLVVFRGCGCNNACFHSTYKHASNN